MSHDEPFLEDGEPLVAAMTRPAMLGGFTLTSIVLSLFIPGLIMMISRSVLTVVLVPAFLLVSYLVCLKDVYLFEIFVSATRLSRCPNKHLWGCRRYAPR
ncbi:VirB3 protein [Cupriavidus basilensis OR16]|uniref:VirB3 protein n=1 Tax=Cupriavidus basilensis OR16 TaxID=1127483 RepID=H1RZU5_9BURK|nr:VirB3 family type IV secretion system protein [Cupriavidus basilensis]EHP44161.1 VirB3 protein [Cupriavidus basilensis OR16]